MLWYVLYLFQKFGQHVWSPSYLILRNALELCTYLTLCPMVPFSIIYLENHTKDPQPEFRVTSLDPAALLQLKTRYACVERCGKKHTAWFKFVYITIVGISNCIPTNYIPISYKIIIPIISQWWWNPTGFLHSCPWRNFMGLGRLRSPQVIQKTVVLGLSHTLELWNPLVHNGIYDSIPKYRKKGDILLVFFKTTPLE